ncbi:hypothetical protein PINS_up012685 [Pythium insidiosum]|nr:hypothetical protein PINS_up012685 [Pythium insidiosum]
MSSVNATEAPQTASAARLAMLEYTRSRIHTLQLFLMTGYGIMFLLSVLLVGYLRLNRRQAFTGNLEAARKIILPAFEPLLVVLLCATGIYTVFFCVALATDLYEYNISKLATEVFYSGRQFVFLSIVVFMLQKSVSTPALQRTVVITFLLSTYTLPLTWYMETHDVQKHKFYVILTVARAFMLLLYTYIFVRPPCRASKRTIREFCVYAYVYYALLFTYNEHFEQGKLETGFNLTYANLLWGSLCPLVIWRVLKADTEHWRGMGQRAVALQSLFRQKNNLPERVSSKGLHVLIEMHRKYIIDFAYLELKQRIGVGASAIVFNGILRSKIPVAVKVYTPSDFTEETVAEFSQEAALCGALHHPNIVKFYGMCVCPPTICLVSELCQGSLEDVACAMARREHHPNRQQLLLNLAYMLDAARAVAYIHSFTPAFLHRDIKPANFLVDAENTVKLTDFGESRSLPRTNILARTGLGAGIGLGRFGNGNGNGSGNGSGGAGAIHHNQHSVAVSSADAATHRESMTLSSGANLQHVRHSEQLAHVDTRMTIKGTVDYMAPEIINGKAGQASYGEAADVYSLGITMWDILYPGQDKYPSAAGNHMRVFEAVSNGHRPAFGSGVHPSVRAVIESAWHGDPRMRPTAQNIVSILETIQEEVGAEFAARLTDACQAHRVFTKLSRSLDRCVAGENVIEVLVHDQFVHDVSEGVRLGNALMDTGVLHHVKHACPFENSEEAYYFEESAIALCRPMDNAVRAGSLPDDGHAMFALPSTSPRAARTAMKVPSEPTELLPNAGLCACRSLSQRLQVPKTNKRRPFRRDRQAQGGGRGYNHSNHPHGMAPSPELQTKLLPELGDATDEWDDFTGFVADASRRETATGVLGEEGVVHINVSHGTT